MQRRQKTASRTKPANIVALRDPAKRIAFADAVGSKVAAWLEDHPAASLEQRAEAFRAIMPTEALEVCGKRERCEEGWFAAKREVLMELVAERNRAAEAARRQQGQAAAAQLKEKRKALKRAVHEAKMKDIEAKIESCSGGQKDYWEVVRALNDRDSRATAVPVQKFTNADGAVCATPKENADAAAKHFTNVYNIVRERPPGAAEAVDSVTQRPVRIDLDAPISLSEVEAALWKMKPGKATPTWYRRSSTWLSARAPWRLGCSTNSCRKSSRARTSEVPRGRLGEQRSHHQLGRSRLKYHQNRRHLWRYHRSHRHLAAAANVAHRILKMSS
jgi:hypothetical protein